MLFLLFSTIFVKTNNLKALRRIIVAILFFYVVPLAGQTNRALLVAIDKYPSGSGWAEIHATNDISLIKPVLEKRNFRDSNIAILTNEQATKKAITEALNSLIAASRSKDHIYIHFSCHGQQMVDDNGDEPDGLDEAIIPYDARRRFEQGVYEGQCHFRDDELNEKLEAIRRKIGPKGCLVLVVDACHSGTADRDVDDDVYVRGTAYIFAPPGYDRGTSVVESMGYDIKCSPELAPITVLSACQPGQLNYEYRNPVNEIYYGSLTYALCDLMSDRNSITYEELRKELVSRIAALNTRRRRQTPLIETTNEEENFNIGR